MSRKSLNELSSRKQKRARLQSLLLNTENEHPELHLNDDNESADSSEAEGEELHQIHQVHQAELEAENNNIQDMEMNNGMEMNNPIDDEDEDLFPGNNQEVEDDAQGFEQPPNDDEIPENDNDWQNHRPLYPGAPLTVAQSMILILVLFFRNNLSMTCIADVITIINLHCLQQGLKKITLKAFQKYFCFNDTQILKHFFCSNCYRDLDSVNDACPSCPRKKNSYFVELQFAAQLKEMFLRRNFYNSLQWRFQHPVNQPGIISDIYDGLLYQEWMQNNFLLNPNNISFSWYTDGVPVFQSSKVSVWPIYLSINELPFEVRKNMNNTLLVGLWFGNQKPDANKFVHRFRGQFERIFQGINVRLHGRNDSITVRGVLLTGTCDLPAKSLFLNVNPYNGEYGCPTCYVKGQSVPTISGGHVFAFPYDNEIRLRTSAETEEYADLGSSNQPYMGVKGHSALSKIMPDFIKGTAIDRMHGVEGGMVKKLLTLWFDVKFRTLPFSLYGFVDQINERLVAIKPPKFVHRMPRCVEDLPHWKASELKLWFFYYSLPVLQGVLRDDFFEHYCLLVVAISLLNTETISREMIEISKNLLHKFVREFQHNYGIEFCSMNVHQLLHFPDVVDNLGPLWAHSCFQYEDLNGQFLRLVHGTCHLDTQIARKHEQIISLTRMIENLPDGSIRDFCLHKKGQVKLTENIFPRCYSVGFYKRLVEIPAIIQTAMLNSRIPFLFLWQYFRLQKNSILYVSKTYKANDLQTESFVVKYRAVNGESKIGSIHSFIKVTRQQCNCAPPVCRCEGDHFAIIHEINSNQGFVAKGDQFTFSSNFFLHKCQETANVIAVSVEALQAVCVNMKIGNKMFVGLPINKVELE